MDRSVSERFQTIWRLAIVVCAILAILTTFIVSCTKAPEGTEVLPSRSAASDEPAVTPEPTPEPTPAPTEEPTQEPEAGTADDEADVSE